MWIESSGFVPEGWLFIAKGKVSYVLIKSVDTCVCLCIQLVAWTITVGNSNPKIILLLRNEYIFSAESKRYNGFINKKHQRNVGAFCVYLCMLNNWNR